VEHTEQNQFVRVAVYDFAARFRAVEDPDTGEARTVQEDWCLYGPAGKEDRQKQWAPVKSLISEPDWDSRGMDPTGYGAQWKRSVIAVVKPQYDAWKRGQAYDTDETPLAAAGLQPEQVKRIQIAGIRSVEQLANAGGNELARIALPEPHKLRATARSFLDMRSNVIATDKVKQLEDQNAALMDRLDEMQRQMASLLHDRVSENVQADEELEALRELAREAGIARVGTKSKETLHRELEELQSEQAA
jgi:hypothetical protein